ncbi:MAG: hypothetical protein AAGK78_03355, partial [Planctomycetota bacterium]
MSNYTVALSVAGEPDSRRRVVVPAGERVALAASVTGPDGALPRVTFRVAEIGATGETRDAETLTATRDDVQYTADSIFRQPSRVKAWAEDADTRWVDVVPMPRPAATEVRVRISPPDYLAGIVAPIDFAGPSGDLTAVTGSAVELAVTPNQSVQEATLQWLAAADHTIESSLPLAVDQTATGTFVVEQDADYRVRFTSGEHGFDSTAEPVWTIKATPDVPPTIAMDNAALPTVAARDEVVVVRGFAVDDLALASVVAEARVGDAWIPVETVEADAAIELPVVATIDLLPLAVTAGETLELRLVAVDAKQQRTASAPAVVQIVERGPGQEMRQRVAAKVQLASAAYALSQATIAWAEAHLSWQSEADGDDDSLSARQALAVLEQRATTARNAARRLLQSADIASQQSRPGRDRLDVRHAGLAAVRVQLAIDAGDPEAGLFAASVGRSLTEAMLRADRVTSAARLVAGAVDARDEITTKIDREQWLALQRQLAGLAAQLELVDQSLDEARRDLGGRGDVLRRIDVTRRELSRAAARLTPALREEPSRELASPALRLLRTLTAERKRLIDVTSRLESRLAEERDAAWPLFAATDALSRVMPANKESAANVEQSLALQSTLARSASIGGNATSAFPADGVLASDLALARSAVAALPADDERRIEAIRDAVETLEAAHALRLLAAEAARLAAEERDGDNVVRAVETTRDLKAWRSRFTATRDALLQGVADPLGKQLSSAVGRLQSLQPMRTLDRQIGRRHQDEVPGRLTDAIISAETELLALLALLDDDVEAARDVLRLQVSPLAEVLRDAADRAENAAASPNDARTTGERDEAVGEALQRL